MIVSILLLLFRHLKENGTNTGNKSYLNLCLFILFIYLFIFFKNIVGHAFLEAVRSASLVPEDGTAPTK